MHPVRTAGTLVTACLAVACASAWAAPEGSAPASGGGTASPTAPARPVDLDVGGHRDFDRVVLRFDGGTPIHAVRYTTLVREPGSGRPVRFADGPVLRATLLNVAPGSVRRALMPRGAAVREVRFLGPFEGRATLAMGVTPSEVGDRRPGFRVFTLSGPPRLVIDVAHPDASTPPDGDTLRLVLEPAGAGTRRWAGWPDAEGPMRWIARNGLDADTRAAIAWRGTVWRGPRDVSNVTRNLVRRFLG